MKRAFLLLAVLLSTFGCGKKVDVPAPANIMAEPAPAEIDNVVILVGDAGAAVWEHSPLPQRVAAEVERWSRALRRDSSVTVVFLGDNIYPRGLRTEPEFFPLDSARLESQVQILAGPAARQYRAFGLFVAGNHDWGNRFGEAGEQRVRNQEDFLTRRRQRGTFVQLLPKAGTPGPGIVDVGRRIRFVLLDTAWWLLSADREEKNRTIARLDTAMRSAGARRVIMAAHHPMKSASAHGGLIDLWDLFGVRWLLYKSGASLQDLNSLPYRDLLNKFDDLFARTGPPLIFAGGHDHNLQLIKAVRDVEPRFMIVSGAGSKNSKVGTIDGMAYRAGGPGYVQLIFMKDRGVDLAAYTAPPDFLHCDTGTTTQQAECVRKGIAEFKRVYAVVLQYGDERE